MGSRSWKVIPANVALEDEDITMVYHLATITDDVMKLAVQDEKAMALVGATTSSQVMDVQIAEGDVIGQDSPDTAGITSDVGNSIAAFHLRILVHHLLAVGEIHQVTKARRLCVDPVNDDIGTVLEALVPHKPSTSWPSLKSHWRFVQRKLQTSEPTTSDVTLDLDNIARLSGLHLGSDVDDGWFGNNGSHGESPVG